MKRSDKIKLELTAEQVQLLVLMTNVGRDAILSFINKEYSRFTREGDVARGIIKKGTSELWRTLRNTLGGFIIDFEDDTEEMTLEEVCKELGKNIKIIK